MDKCKKCECANEKFRCETFTAYLCKRKINTSIVYIYVDYTFLQIFISKTGIMENMVELNRTLSEGMFALSVLVCMLAVWLIKKHYKTSIKRILAVGYFVSGYFFTYLECNKNLDTEQRIRFIKLHEPNEEGLFRKLTNFLFGSNKQEQRIQRIREENKINLPFCRPDEVLKIYIKESLDYLKMINENYFPFTYIIAALVCLPFIFMGMSKLFLHIWPVPIRDINTKHQPKAYSNADRLTGDNLRIFFRANAQRANAKEKTISPSGVEQIFEPRQTAACKENVDYSIIGHNSICNN